MNEIESLAKNEFLNDNRFIVCFDSNQQKLYQLILKKWISGMNEIFICKLKGMVIGFADVETFEEINGMPFIKLAAVDKRYAQVGSALSLYAFVFQYYKERGFSHIYGRISSKNMGAVNLYRSLGGEFYGPQDIYIKL